MLVRAVVTSVVGDAQGVGVVALYYITSFWVMGLQLYVVAMCQSRVEMGFRSERSTETRWAQVVVLLVVLLAILGKSLLVVCHYCEMFMLCCPGKLGMARNGGARDLDKQGDTHHFIHFNVVVLQQSSIMHNLTRSNFTSNCCILRPSIEPLRQEDKQDWQEKQNFVKRGCVGMLCEAGRWEACAMLSHMLSGSVCGKGRLFVSDSAFTSKLCKCPIVSTRFSCIPGRCKHSRSIKHFVNSIHADQSVSLGIVYS